MTSDNKRLTVRIPPGLAAACQAAAKAAGVSVNEWTCRVLDRLTPKGDK